jgi:hypothetical protein
VVNGDAPPTFVLPNDNPGYHEPLQRFTDVLETVDTTHPDVRLLAAHASVAVAAVLADSDDAPCTTTSSPPRAASWPPAPGGCRGWSSAPTGS